jgi:hypothetical protein
LGNLYAELFDWEELNPAVADELMDYGNVVLIRSILLLPEYRGQGRGGLLALAIAERFDERDIVALKPWPMVQADFSSFAAISCLLRRSNAISDGFNIREAGEVPSFRLSKAVEGVTESLLPPLFKFFAMFMPQFCPWRHPHPLILRHGSLGAVLQSTPRTELKMRPYLSPRFPKSAFEGRAAVLHPPPRA